MSDKSSSSKPEFRGLTIFELLVIGTLLIGTFLWGAMGKKNLQNQLDDQKRQTNVTAVRDAVRAYQLLEGGGFPSEATFNDETRRSLLFAELISEAGKNVFSDPKDSNVKIEYLAEPEGCDNLDTECTKISVSLLQSNGEEFVRFAIKPGTEGQYLEEASQDGSDEAQTEELLNELESIPEAGE